MNQYDIRFAVSKCNNRNHGKYNVANALFYFPEKDELRVLPIGESGGLNLTTWARERGYDTEVLTVSNVTRWLNDLKREA